jgi:hypothetical protein
MLGVGNLGRLSTALVRSSNAAKIADIVNSAGTFLRGPCLLQGGALCSVSPRVIYRRFSQIARRRLFMGRLYRLQAGDLAVNVRLYVHPLQ